MYFNGTCFRIYRGTQVTLLSDTHESHIMFSLLIFCPNFSFLLVGECMQACAHVSTKTVFNPSYTCTQCTTTCHHIIMHSTTSTPHTHKHTQPCVYISVQSSMINLCLTLCPELSLCCRLDSVVSVQVSMIIW